MKKMTKKDLVYLSIIVLSFISFTFILSNSTYIYGSTTDWYAQHISIPEYFRTLFYNTHDLLPDFAFNIGNGQNIYNLSYYGLLSPIVLISYLFPNVSMMTYLIITSIMMVIISTILLYLFLKSKKYSSEVCFISSLIFIFSSSISLHSHRHIMFINYMPFLILALFGVDKIFKENKSWLLIISTFLMIMTSYYFSVGGIVCIFLYALYLYINNEKKVKLKTAIKIFGRILLPVVIAILCSAILTLPTFLTLLNNRADSNVTISLSRLLIPRLNLSNIIYRSYGLGLSAIVLPALINMVTKKKESKVLGIILVSLVIFNIFNFLLNGMMYIDGKSLIPFLPLYILAIAEFIKDIFGKKLKYKELIISIIIISILVLIGGKYIVGYFSEIIILLLLIFLYNKFNKKVLFIVPLFIVIITGSFLTNRIDRLELKYTTKNDEKIVGELLKNVTDNDNSFYRIAINYNRTKYPNKIFSNIDYYTSTIYSSIANQTYNKFYYDEIMNNIPSRNRALTLTSPNLLYLFLSNNKYYISNGKAPLGYELISSKDNLNVYKNSNVLPIGFANSNIMSYEDYEKLEFVEKQEALLDVIVANEKSNNNYSSDITEAKLDLNDIFNGEDITKEDDESYTIKVKDNLNISYELPEEYQNKILFIRFKMNRMNERNDLSITINTVKNKLTNKKWKYFNGNTVFDYVLGFSNQEKLNIFFTEGIYNISDFESYYMDYEKIENVINNVDPLLVNKKDTKGDYIVGDIDVKKDSYFMLTIPYDKGFNIKVDEVSVDYEKVDEAFIGFKISKGKHHIEIEYKAPGKVLSLYLVLIGLISFIVVNYFEAIRKH